MEQVIQPYVSKKRKPKRHDEEHPKNIVVHLNPETSSTMKRKKASKEEETFVYEETKKNPQATSTLKPSPMLTPKIISSHPTGISTNSSLQNKSRRKCLNNEIISSICFL
jgi:hypothetical protein